MNDLGCIEILQFQIKQQEISLVCLYPCHSLRAGGSGGDGMALAFQRFGRQPQEAGIIINH